MPTPRRKRNTMTQERLRTGQRPVDMGSVGLLMSHGYLTRRHSIADLATKFTAIQQYRKMEADPTVSGTLQAFINISGMVDWQEVGADEKFIKGQRKKISSDSIDPQKAEDYRLFLKSCMEDMNQSWHDIVEAALDMLIIGHNVQVPQFKVRRGYYPNQPNWNSKFDDRRIGWKSWKTLDPQSIIRWICPNSEGYTELQGLEQFTTRAIKTHIPRNRFLLFRTTSRGDLPEGESMLYGAYSTWARKEEFLNIENVAHSRNLEGIPKITVPADYLRSTASAEEKATIAYAQQVGQHLKFNEQTSITIPAMYDDKNNKLFDVELMTASNNTRLDASRAVIKDDEKLIAESMLSSFIKLGGGTGSHALSLDQTDMFILAMRTYLNRIKQVINDEAIPTLFGLNGFDEPEYWPRIEFSGLEKDNVTQFIDNLVKAIEKGAVVPTADTQKAVLEKLELSAESADEAWEEKEKQAEEDRALANDATAASTEVTRNPPQMQQEPRVQKSAEAVYGTDEDGNYYQMDEDGEWYPLEEPYVAEEGDLAMDEDRLYQKQNGSWAFICDNAVLDQNGDVHFQNEQGIWEKL